MDKVLMYLRESLPQLKDLNNNEIENYVVETVMGTPYERASLEQIYDIVQLNYYPGLFQMSERKEAPAFLLEENKVPFEKWLSQKFYSEIVQLCQSKFLVNKINKVGIETLIKYSLDILNFKNKQNKLFVDLIINQEYSDIFRRIVMFLIMGTPFYVYNNHFSFNALGKKIAPLILRRTENYCLRERLFQSIASGMIGMDIKEKNISTAPISLESSLALDGKSDKEITNELDKYIHNINKIGIDCFDQYYDEVICGKNLEIVWFTDDYIESIFEMKFIEEQLNINRTLSFTLVPRYDSYSNDASYDDIFELLELKELKKLKEYYKNGKFNICKNGMDISSVDFFRMSSELYDVIRKADICVISGARAFEMTQGFKKIVYYTGIAVCKSYTESITGFSRNSGKLVFIRQGVGEYSFKDFRARAWRKIQDDNEIINVAKVTAKEYYMEKKMINKLVRDNIPEIIKSKGRIPIYDTIKEENIYVQLLKSKLQEEVMEYLESGEIVELCDIVEVIYALLKVHEISHSEFEDMRNKKATINGVFEKKIFLEKIK